MVQRKERQTGITSLAGRAALFLLALSVALLALMLPSVIAVSQTVENNLTWLSGATGTWEYRGVVFTVTEEVDIVNVTVDDYFTGTHVHLYNITGTTAIENAAFSGNTATFSSPYTLSPTTVYYLGFNKEGATTFDNAYNSTYSGYYPNTHEGLFTIEYGARGHTVSDINNVAYSTYNWDSVGLDTSASPPGVYTFIKIKIQDLYDYAIIEGLNITLLDGTSNLTNAAGIATFNSTTQSFNITDPQHRYFFYESPSNPADNATTTYNLTGAFPSFNASNLAGVYLQNFTVCSPISCNYTGSSSTKLLLPPNSSLNITIIGYDGNHTAAINDTNQTYINKTYLLTTTGRDTSNYNISGLYQVYLTVNVSRGLTTNYLSNFTANLTGPLNYSVFTSNYTTTHELMIGDYNILIDPAGYSLNNASYSFALRNFTPTVTIPVYALNSFYLSFLNEITRQNINDPMTLELISDATAGNYSTTNGSLVFELLTPADYTIRWRGANWPERDYYQTLINQNYYNLNLYSLSNGNASTLLVTVVDTTGRPIEGAEIQLRRYFVYCNCYEVVEMAQSSFSGEAFFNVDSYDGHYKLAVTYGGQTLLTASPENYIPEESGVVITRTITFNTGSDYYESYAALPDITRTLVYNDVTGAFSFAWADPSGLVEYGCFVVEYANRTQYEVISTCQNGSNGNVLYSLPDPENTTYRYYAHVETSTNYSDYTLFAGYKDADPAINFGAAGYFLGGIIVIFFGLIGAAIGAIGGLVFTALSMVLVIALGLLPLGWGLATGLITLIAGLGIFLMRR